MTTSNLDMVGNDSLEEPHTPLQAPQNQSSPVTNTPSQPLLDKFHESDSFSYTGSRTTPISRTSSQASATKTPSKPLVDKFEALEQSWSAVKSLSAQRSENFHRKTSISTIQFSSPVRSLVLPPLLQRTSKANNAQESFSSPDGDSSVGGSTISTLSSAEESVFDRLYRSGIRQPRSKPNASASDRRTSYTPKMAGPSPRSQKNRVGNYTESHSLSGRKSMTTRGRQSSIHSLISPSFAKDTSSVVSALSDYQDDESSVFHRLHRNEKRKEKLWRAPQCALIPSKKTNLSRRSVVGKKRSDQEENIPPLSTDHTRAVSGVFGKPKKCAKILSEHRAQNNLNQESAKNSSGSNACEVTLSKSDAVARKIHPLREQERNNQGPQKGSVDNTSATDYITSATKVPEEPQASQEVAPEEREKLEACATTKAEEFRQRSGIIQKQLTPKRTNTHLKHDGETINAVDPISPVIITPEQDFDDVSNTCSLLSETPKQALHMPIQRSNVQRRSSSQSGFFSLDESTGGLVMAYRPPSGMALSIERLSSPPKRRRWPYDTDQVLTPGRLREVSIVTIQRAWRKHRAQFDRMKLSAIVIQRTWRRHRFSNDRTRVITRVQARWRARRRERHLKRSMLQRRYLSAISQVSSLHSKRQEYPLQRNVVALQSAVLSLQRVYRQRRAREFYLQQRSAAIVLQSYWRRRRLALQSKEATVIQSLWRGSLARSFLLSSRTSASMIQSLMRGVLLRRKMQQQCIAAIAIQRICRGRAARNFIKSKRRAVALFEGDQAVLIQRSWRMIRERRRFILSNHAAVVLQKYARRKHAISNVSEFRHLKLQQASATTLQSAWRLTLAKRELSVLKMTYLKSRRASAALTMQRTARQWLAWNSRKLRAAVAIQATWRASHARGSYCTIRVYVISIQSIVRAWLEFKKYETKMSAAQLIQSLVRGNQTRNSHKKQLCAAVCIQKYWRSSSARGRLSDARAAAIMIETLARGYIVRTQLKKELKSSIAIQRYWRGYLGQLAYDDLLRSREVSAIIIQRDYRRHHYKNGFDRKVGACMSIQRVYRGTRVRATIAMRHSAAFTIQCGWISFRTHKTYVRANKAATIIQSVYRMTMAKRLFSEVQSKNAERAAALIQQFWRRKVQEQKESRHRSSVQIQRVWRASLSRKTIHRFRIAAIIIQAFARQRFESTAYRRKKMLCTKLQAKIRGYRLYSRFKTLSKATHTLQSFWRGSLVRSRYNCARSSAIAIQSTVRAHLALKAFQRSIQACRLIQAYHRSIQSRICYLEQVSAIIEIQKHWRASSARSYYMNNRSSATMIQATIRSHLTAKAFRRTLDACKIIQRHWRASSARSYYMHVRCSATMIQATFRSHLMAKAFRRTLDACKIIQVVFRSERSRRRRIAKTHAVIVIQKCWRTSQALSSYRATRASVILIQSMVRSYRAVNDLQRELAARRLLHASQVRSVIKIQKHWRTSLALSSYDYSRTSAILVQSVIRRHFALKKYTCTLLSCKKIQAQVRSRLVVCRFKALVQASIVVQKNWRASIARSDFLTSRSSAIMIQGLCRGVATREVRRQQISATVHWQRLWRGRTARLMVSERQRERHNKARFQELACATIQSNWRMYRCRSCFLLHRSAALKLQSYARCASSIEKLKTARRAATAIQALFRGKEALVSYRIAVKACTIIQTAWRRWSSVKKHEKVVFALVLIQAHWRGSIARHAFVMNRVCAAMIQSVIRRALAGKLYKQRLATLKVQAAVRGYIHRNTFRRLRSLAIMIQALWRRASSRRRLVVTRNAACAIQSEWRKFVAQRIFLHTRKAFRAFQRLWRSRLHKNHLRRSSVLIQSIARGFMARSEITRRRIQSRDRAERELCKVVARARTMSAITAKEVLLGDGSAPNVGPCLLRLARRVRFAVDEASQTSTASLPGYARSLLQGTPPFRGMDTDATVDHASMAFKTTEESIASISRKVSTPVRGNRTPTLKNPKVLYKGSVQSIVRTSSSVGTASKETSVATSLDQEWQHPDNQERPQQRQCATSSLDKQTQSPIKDLLKRAKWLRMEGRKAIQQQKSQSIQCMSAHDGSYATEKISDQVSNEVCGADSSEEDPDSEYLSTKLSQDIKSESIKAQECAFGDPRDVHSTIKTDLDWNWTNEW